MDTEKKEATTTTEEGTTETATTDATQSGQTEEAKTFSQEDLNRLLGERATRAKATAQNELLEKLGVSTVEDAVGILAGERAKRDAEKSETELLQERLSNAEKATSDALYARNATLIELQTTTLAPTLGVDASNLGLLLKVLERGGITVEGVEVSGVKEAIEAALVEYPALKGKAQQAQGNDAGSAVDKAKKTKTPETTLGDSLADKLIRKHGSI